MTYICKLRCKEMLSCNEGKNKVLFFDFVDE